MEDKEKELIYENKDYRCKVYVNPGMSKKKKDIIVCKWGSYFKLNRNSGVSKKEIILDEGFLFDDI